MNDGAVRIIFHAGFHKTGTSSLQSSLAAHAGWLGPDILLETRALSRRFLAAAEAARQFSIHQSAADLKTLHSDLAEWAETVELGPGQVLVASSEDFAGHIPGNHGVKDYAAARAIALAIAEQLQRRFGPNLALKLLYTTRAPEAWIRSIHWQLAKNPRPAISLRRYTQIHGPAADFAPLIASIGDLVRAAVPGAEVCSASLEQLQDRRLGPVEAIYDLIGLDEDLRASLPPKPPANQGPPYDLADTFMTLNRVGMPRETLTRVKRAIIKAVERDRDGVQ